MLKFTLSLVGADNDYQRAQAAAGEEMARRLGASIEVSYCDGDAIEQSQHLLKLIQSQSSAFPTSGIIVQPAGTGLRQVAQAAVAAGIGWVVLHKHVDYIAELLQPYSVPVFMVSSDHTEEGRIQAKQLAQLFPDGGMTLYVIGPRSDSITQARFEGMKQAMPSNIHLLTVSGKWTEQSGYEAISSWLRLQTSQQQPIAAIVSQNDTMAFGVKRALNDLPPGPLRERLLNLPMLGCDGLPASGQAWVRQRRLRATVIVPVLAGVAVELLVKAIGSGRPPLEHTVVPPASYPPLAELL